MSQKQHKSRFYFLLRVLLENGLPLHKALGSDFEGRFQKIARRLQKLVMEGLTLSAAMQQFSVFTPMETALVKVGEKCGTLPEILRTLSEQFEAEHLRARRVLGNLAYPLFVYFAAGPILTVIRWFQGQTAPCQILCFLLSWFAMPFAVYFVLKLLWRTFRSLSGLGIILDAVPVCGRIQYLTESSRFFQVVAIGLHSGLLVTEAIAMAADCCHSGWYRNRYASLVEKIRSGNSFYEAFSSIMTSRDRHSPIPMLLQSGEASGTLDQSCRQIALILSEELTAKLDMLAKVIPGIIYGGIVLYLAMQIITLFSGYIAGIQSLLN